MAQEVITRRRVIRSDDEVAGTADESAQGLGMALAVALAILALLVLFALARGIVSPAPSNNATPRTNVQTQTGTSVD